MSVVEKKYSNGTSYSGEVNENMKRHGYGTMHFRDGKYEGNWVNGKQQGTGRYQWNSGSVYEGEWSEGRFHGVGEYKWPSGAVYTGAWVNGKKEGEGTFQWANGTKYSGTFKDDKKCGNGTYLSGTDGTLYYGGYVDDMMEGLGTYIFPDGARYVGEFYRNNFHGKGAYTTPDNTVYLGEFKDDQRHGRGFLKSPYLGTFLVRYQGGACLEHSDIAAWLRTNGCEFAEARFAEEHVTFDVLPTLGDEDLKSLGAALLGDRKRLRKAISRLPLDLLEESKGGGSEHDAKKTTAAAAGSFSRQLALLERSATRMSMQISRESLAMSGSDADDLDLDSEGTLYADMSGVSLVAEGEDGELMPQRDSGGAPDAGGGLLSRRGSRMPARPTLSAGAAVAGGGGGGAQQRMIPYHELRMEKAAIGKGVFGVVYRATWRGADVCVKMLQGQLGRKEKEELRTEARTMVSVCHHPHVVSYVGLVNNRSDPLSPYGLVTAFYPRGSLYDVLIRRREDVPWKLVVRMARDAAAGILHLHAEHVIHRDIAARNCLIDEGWRCVVTDFGLARVKAGAYLQSNNNFGPVCWMAPEALLEKTFSETTDTYSFGVLLWELVARDAPFKGLSPYEIAQGVLEGMRPEIPEHCPPEFAQLMQQCWKREPLDRPTFEGIIKSLEEYFFVIE